MIDLRSLALASVLPLATLPAQDRSKRWYAMDYGPVISSTIQGFESDNVAYKGRAIDLGGGAWVLFDTELLRVAAVWTDGYLQLRGTTYDGGHGPVPMPSGIELYESPRAPGWAVDGSFDDPRDSRYGPLPRERARYGGFYLHGDRVVLAYDVAGTRVLETFDRVEHDGASAVSRTIDAVGVPASGARVCIAGVDGQAVVEDGAVVIRSAEPRIGRVTLDRVDDWSAMAIGAPSKTDYADAASGNGVTARWIDGFGKLHDLAARPAGLIDGAVPSQSDEPGKAVYSDGRRARFALDLQRSVDVSRVNVFSWHKSDRSRQKYRLFGSDAAVAPSAKGDPAKSGWTLIANVDTNSLGQGGRHGSSVGNVDGAPLGKFRHLMWDAVRASGGTFYGEVDVWVQGQATKVTPRTRTTRFALSSAPAGARLAVDGDRVVLDLPAKPTNQRVEIVTSSGGDASKFAGLVRAAGTAADPNKWTRGGGARYPEELTTKGRLGKGKGAYVVDHITVPAKNPWNSWLRFGAFDFVGTDAAVLSTWNGDVWRVTGLDDDLDELKWRRIATGLHDPLGLKVVDGVIHTHGRDGITRLHDLDGDGEIDWYENFNNDVLVTRNFHEFAFDLQTDAEGNFYFSKGGPVRPGGRGFDEIVAHHGTIMKVSKDGSQLDVVATGLRAPNGIGVSPDGVLTSGDNQGTWMPACRLNWLPRHGMFTSCVDTAHTDPKPTKYGDPLCWFPMDVDNSGGGQVWVSNDRWGPLQGRLLHQSYGTCNIYLVLEQHDGDRTQGGVVKFPLSFSSAQMRARFHDAGDGQLYTTGFKGWQTRAARDTAFERVRYTGRPLAMPVGMRVVQDGIELTFAEPIDAELGDDPGSYAIEIWDYKWSEAYGSAEYKPSDPKKVVREGTKNRDTLKVRSAKTGADGRTVVLGVDGLRRCMQIRIAYDLESKSGDLVAGDIIGTVNYLPTAR